MDRRSSEAAGLSLCGWLCVPINAFAVRHDANERRWPGPEALAWCVASEAPEAGDDVVGGGVRQLPEEHFGELHFAGASAVAS